VRAQRISIGFQPSNAASGSLHLGFGIEPDRHEGVLAVLAPRFVGASGVSSSGDRTRFEFTLDLMLDGLERRMA
jgi:hypothetical protein